MTLNDDSSLELLERDLRALAQPHEGDERLRQAIRHELAVRTRPRRDRRLSIRFALGGAVVSAAAAAVALVAVLGTNGSGGPAVADAAIVHHALTAVTPPPNAILHEKVVAVQNGTPVVAEAWLETSPPYAGRGRKGPAGHSGEFADDGTTSFAYDPSTNTLYERPDTARPTFSDPIAQVRDELARGQANVIGTAAIDGRTLYEIGLAHGLVGYFDMTNYLPRYLDDPQRDGTVVRLRVAAYEYLPLTAARRAGLSLVVSHPTARIDTDPRDWPLK